MPRIRASNIAEHKVITRALILEKAQEQFAAWGYEDTSFGDIAAAVDMGRTTLYDYFSDKDDLLASLVEETLPQIIENLIARIPDDATPLERLQHLVVLTLEFLATEPTLGRVLHREVPKLSETARQRVSAAHLTLAREFVETYRAGVDSGTLRSLPPGLAGRFLNDLIMSAAQALIEAKDPRVELPVVAGAVTGFMLNGLARGWVEKTIPMAVVKTGGELREVRT